MEDERHRKNDRNSAPLFLLILVSLAVAAGGISLGSSIRKKEAGTAQDGASAAVPQDGASGDQKGTQTEAESPSDSSGAFFSLDVSEVAAAALPSVVAITGQSVQEAEDFFRGRTAVESETSGSGIIVGETEGELLIATNYHVIADAGTLTVCFSADLEEEAAAAATVKGSDEQNDLAVLAVSLDAIDETVLAQISVAVLGSSESLVIGEPAIAIGNALGCGQSVTAGIISALNRTISVDGVTNEYIQTDAAINFGNSGGALLNAAGEVIGINSAKAAVSGAEGMGYAIPIDAAEPILNELMNRETREKAPPADQGYLGVYTQDISAEAHGLYDIPNGICVAMVIGGSPADQAGLQRGDIISSLDGSPVQSTAAFDELLEYYCAGETVKLEYLRAGRDGYEPRDTEVTFSQQPERGGTQQPRGDGSYYSSGWPF